MLKALGSLALVLSLAACGADAPDESSSTGGGQDSSQKDGPNPRFIKQIRKNVPGAQAYDDEFLGGIATNICSLETVENGVKILDNYSKIEPEDYEEFAQITLRTACD